MLHVLSKGIACYAIQTGEKEKRSDDPEFPKIRMGGLRLGILRMLKFENFCNKVK